MLMTRLIIEKENVLLNEKEAFPISLTYLVYITETMLLCLRSQFTIFIKYSIISKAKRN